METLFFYGQDDPNGRYVREIRGIEQALHRAHIPFDIISTRTLLQRGADDVLARYRALVLPSLACMFEDEASMLRSYVAGGGALLSRSRPRSMTLSGFGGRTSSWPTA